MLGIKRCLVRFSSAKNTVVGAGFLAAPGIVLTCEHVVRDALGLPEEAPVEAGASMNLDFPFLKSGLLPARVLKADAEKDIAVLRLEVDSPPDARSALLVAPQETWNHPCGAFGFARGHPHGVWAEGKLRGPIGDIGWLQIDAARDSAYFVEKGFSGAPLWDNEAHGVVGMVVTREKCSSIRAAFCIPTSQLTEFWPVSTENPPEPFLPPLPKAFIGRKEEIEEFQRALSALSGCPDTSPANRMKRVFLIRGEGGMGKSTLLRHYVDLCREHPGDLFWIYVDWDREGVNSSQGTPAMMEVIARYIEENLRQNMSRYRDVWVAWRKVQEKVDPWRRHQWPSKEAFEQFLETNLSPEEHRLYENHQRALSEAFIQDLLQLAQERIIVFLWDSCEMVWGFANQWIKQGLLRLCLHSDRRHRFLFVFAGRLPERPVEIELRDALGDQLYRRYLDRFTPSDIARYFSELGVSLSAEKAQEIYEATLGVPLAVGVVADMLLEKGDLEELFGGPEQFAEMSEQDVVPLITTRFLKYLLNQPEEVRERESRAIYSLALLREGTKGHYLRRSQILRELWFKLGLVRSKEEFYQMYRSLCSRYSFLSTGDIHPDVRLFIRRDLRSLSDVRIQEICEKGRDICSSHLQRYEKELRERYGEERARTERYKHENWQQWFLDLVEFLLWLREYDQGMEWLIEHYILGMQFGVDDFHQRLISLFRDPIFYDELRPQHRELVNKLTNLNEWLSISELDAEREYLLGRLKGEAQIAGRLLSAKAAIKKSQLFRARSELEQAEDSYRRLGIRNDEVEKRLGEMYLLFGEKMMRSSKRRQVQQESLEIFQKAQRWIPDNPQLHYMTGITLINLGHLEEARLQLLQIKKSSSFHRPAQNALNRIQSLMITGYFRPSKEAKRLTMRASVHSALGEFDTAEQLFRKALQLSSIYIPARVKLVHLLRQEARIEEAFEILGGVDTNQITDDQLRASVYDAYGALYASKGKWDEAITFYKKAIESSSEYINPYIGLGKVYIRQNQPGEALRELKNGWEIKMRCPVPIKASLFWVQNNMGIAHLMAGQHMGAVISFQFAEALCRKQLDRESRLYQTQIGLGLSLMGQQKYSDAVEILSNLELRFSEIRKVRGLLQEVLKDIELIGIFGGHKGWEMVYKSIAVLL